MAVSRRKLVAIVVPLSDREQLTAEEDISLRHLKRFLGRYDKYFVAPRNLHVDFADFEIKRFDNKFFGSLAAHTKLMLSPEFYRSFPDYKYILIYHLDSLVFSDQLEEWCEEDYDFIGAPWIKFDGAPYAGMPGNENKVGNGGFSLRKIQSFLRVIYSPKYCEEPSIYWERRYASAKTKERLINLPKKFLKHLHIFNNARWEMSRFKYNEEVFWTNRASHYYPDFKIAPLETALRFSFECGPRICFEKNNRTLPFGCHAWHKYDREFWEPFLLGEGYKDESLQRNP